MFRDFSELLGGQEAGDAKCVSCCCRGGLCLFNELFGVFCKVAGQKQQKCSRAFVFVMAKVTKTTSFLPGKTWLLQNIRFCNKPPGYPEEPGNCMCVPSSQAELAPAPRRQGCRLPSPGASNIPAVFFLPPGKAKAPNVPTRKIRTFVF